MDSTGGRLRKWDGAKLKSYATPCRPAPCRARVGSGACGALARRAAGRPAGRHSNRHKEPSNDLPTQRDGLERPRHLDAAHALELRALHCGDRPPHGHDQERRHRQGAPAQAPRSSVTHRQAPGPEGVDPAAVLTAAKPQPIGDTGAGACLRTVPRHFTAGATACSSAIPLRNRRLLPMAPWRARLGRLQALRRARNLRTSLLRRALPRRVCAPDARAPASTLAIDGKRGTHELMKCG